MYYIKIKGTNNYIEATERKLDIEENLASFLTFKLLSNNEYIGKLKRYITLIEVYNDDIRVFDGRVIDIVEDMSEEGIISYEVICESILNFFNDTRVGEWDIHPESAPENEKPDETITATIYENMTVQKTLELILNNHNSKVADNKKIHLGNVSVEGNVFCYCRYDTSLKVIQSKLVEKHGGYLIIREVSGRYYLDYLKELSQRENLAELGINLKSFQRENNLKSIITRLIAFGKDDITFSSINDGKNYVEDTSLINEVGLFEAVHKWDDVTIPENLLKKAQEKLKEINKENYSISISALDLYLISEDYNEFEVSQTCIINNSILGVKDKNRIISKNINLDEPWLSTLVLSTHPPSAINNSTSIKTEIDNTKIEILITDKKLASKISNGEFESYQEQVAEGFKQTVKKGELESYQEQVAEGFKQTVKKGKEFESEVLLAANKYQISMNGKLGGKTYTFDGTSFKLGGTDSGNKAEHTNNHSKWIHENGHYSIAKANGFFRNNGAGEREIKSCDYMVLRPGIRNGRTETVILPADFANKEINTDFTVVLTNGSINSDIGAALKDGAIRNLFLKTISWNKTTRELVVQPCLQKIGLTSKTFYGWDASSTSPGNPVGEGSIDMIIMAQI